MERVLSNDITKYLIILGAGAAALLLVLGNMVASIRGAFKPYQRATLLYLVVAVVFFAALALCAFPGVIEHPMSLLLCLQAMFLLMGCGHAFLMPRNLEWAGDEKSFGAELVFTILIALFGAAVFLLIYRLLNKNGLQYMMAGSILLFLVPFLFYHTFQAAVSIPPKILKEWFYPVNREMDDPEDAAMSNLLVISFEFQKQATDDRITNFRAKAPANMAMGQLFYYFINDYNDRHPNSKVQYLNEMGGAYGWIFYKKPKWYTVVTQYIDADKTIFNNNIKENDVIICSRSLS